MTHENPDAVGTLLRTCRPPEPGTSAQAHLDLARAVVASDRGLVGRLRRTRRHRRALAATAAVAVLVPSGAWAAQHFLAQTGAFGDATRNPGLEDGSELIDTCAGDLAGFTAAVAPTDLPVAPGHSWTAYAGSVAAASVDPGSCTSGQWGTTQETTLRQDLLARASSDWGCVLVGRPGRRPRRCRAGAGRDGPDPRPVAEPVDGARQWRSLGPRRVSRRQPPAAVQRMPSMTRAEADFEGLVRAHGARVLAYLTRRLPSPEDAADAYQDTLTTVWRKVHSVPDEPSAALPWLLAVARRTAANHRRARTRRLAATERLASELTSGGGGGSSGRGTESGLPEQVRDALAELAEDDREVLALTYWEGLDAAQVAVVLGLRPATVRKRIERARRRLGARLGDPVAAGARGC